MPRQPVTSSSINSIGYLPEQQTLEVEFVRGTIYQYFDVPPVAHQLFLAAESKGIFFNRHIRGHFSYRPA